MRPLGRYARRISALVIACATTPTQARVLQHTVRYDAAHFHVEGNATKRVVADQLATTWEQGQPELPYDVVTLLVPRGARIRGVTATLPAGNAFWWKASPSQPRARAPIRMAACTSRRCRAPPRRFRHRMWMVPRAYRPRAPRPPATVPCMGINSLRCACTHCATYPTRVSCSWRRRSSSRSISKSPRRRPSSGRAAAPRSRPRRPGRCRDGSPIPKRSTVTTAASASASRSRRRLPPTDAPSLEGSDVDYVIITNEALARQWQVLADWKTRRGVPTVVRTIEWIQANYRRGSDLQETIRTFIQDAYAKWGVQYVALGRRHRHPAGALRLLRVRPGRPNATSHPISISAASTATGTRTATACWGEAAISISDPGDSTDFYAEVFVGPLAAQHAGRSRRLRHQDDRLRESDPDDLPERSAVLGRGPVPGGLGPGARHHRWTAPTSAEELVALTGACVRPKRCTRTIPTYPGSLPLTRRRPSPR